MAIQTATTGNLENVQNTVLAAIRYYQEYNAPVQNLVERFTLGQGVKTMTVPKLGQAPEPAALTDGQDIISSEDLSVTTTDLTCSEVGFKYIVTDKLLRQSDPSVFTMVGRQMGDGTARKRDKDLIALFSALNGSTTLGVDAAILDINNASACVAFAHGNYGKEAFPNPVSFVHHPNAIYGLVKSAAGVGTTYFPGILTGLQEEKLRNFWRMNIAGVNFIEAGNIAKIASVDSAYGAIFSKSALALIVAKDWSEERQRDASLRAWEIVMVSDYGVFELDDSYGAPARYEIGNVSTT